MARNQQLQTRRNGKILKRFKEIRAETFKGKPKYRYDVTLEILSDEFDLATATIEKIIINNSKNNNTK